MRPFAIPPLPVHDIDMAVKASDVLTKEEITDLHRRSDARGLLAVASCWAVIAGAFALTAWHPAWWTVLLSLVLLGSRQLGLAILMHEASHHSLFASRPLNNFFGSWFAGYPIWTDLFRYREHHMRHHAFTGSDRDPDMALVNPFPSHAARSGGNCCATCWARQESSG